MRNDNYIQLLRRRANRRDNSLDFKIMARSALLRKDLLRNAGADCKPNVVSMMTKSKRPFEAAQLRTRFRGWELIATEHSVTGKKSNGEQFEIGRLKDMETALRMGKRKVDRLEGVQVWIEGYENEALR